MRYSVNSDMSHAFYLRSILRFVLGFLLSAFQSFVHSGELLKSYVNEQDDHYVLHLDMRIAAKFDRVYEVLMDFSKMAEVNDSIKSSELIESNGKTHKMRFQTEGCIWFFCRKVRQMVTVTELGQGYILSETHPKESDLRYGKALWQIINEGDNTRVKYNADFVPDFWVPPIFGPAIFQDRMLEEGKKTLNGIERLSAPTNNQ